MAEDTLIEFLLQEKPSMIIKQLRLQNGESYAQPISREVDTTYAHAVKIIDELKERGLVEARKEGRKKILTLTEKGETVAEATAQFMQKLEEVEDTDGISSDSNGGSLAGTEIQG